MKPNCTAPNSNPYECNTVDGFVAAFDTTKSGNASLVYATRIAGSAPDVQGNGSNPMQQIEIGVMRKNVGIDEIDAAPGDAKLDPMGLVGVEAGVGQASTAGSPGT